MPEALNKGEYYTTIKDGELCADVYKHATAEHIYVADLYQEGRNEQLTIPILAYRYKKELNDLFFNPLAQELWNIAGVFEAIKQNRVSA